MDIKDLQKACSILGLDYNQFIESPEIEKGVGSIDYNLENFKQKVINCLKKKFNYTKEDIEDCLQERKEIWEQYMKDFSPKTTAQGIASGLI